MINTLCYEVAAYLTPYILRGLHFTQSICFEVITFSVLRRLLIKHICSERVTTCIQRRIVLLKVLIDIYSTYMRS